VLFFASRVAIILFPTVLRRVKVDQ